jgi:hypothetical protein
MSSRKLQALYIGEEVVGGTGVLALDQQGCSAIVGTQAVIIAGTGYDKRVAPWPTVQDVRSSAINQPVVDLKRHALVPEHNRFDVPQRDALT